MADNDPDAVVIDAMFSSALDVAPKFARPTADMLHTFFDRLYDSWVGNFAMQSESRLRAGFDGLPDLDTVWGERDVLTSIRSLRSMVSRPHPGSTWFTALQS